MREPPSAARYREAIRSALEAGDTLAVPGLLRLMAEDHPAEARRVADAIRARSEGNRS